MSTKNILSRITLDIPKVDHMKLKAIAALEGKSMREIILESIKETLKTNYPNAETIRAIENVEQGKNLIEIENLDEFFKKLDV